MNFAQAKALESLHEAPSGWRIVSLSYAAKLPPETWILRVRRLLENHHGERVQHFEIDDYGSVTSTADGERHA